MAPSSTWPKGRSLNQRTLELAAHVIFRDAFLLVQPGTPLPVDIAGRLAAFKIKPRRCPVSRDFLNEMRENARLLTRDSFYNHHMTLMLSILNLISRLENLRDVEMDMKSRLEGRLGQVRMVQRVDEKGAVTWVLEMEEGGCRRG